MSAACALFLRCKLPHMRTYVLRELCMCVLQNTSSFIIGEIKFGRCFAIRQTAKLKSLPNLSSTCIWYVCPCTYVHTYALGTCLCLCHTHTVLHRKRLKTSTFCTFTLLWYMVVRQALYQSTLGYIIILSCDFHVEKMTVTSTRFG